MCGTMRFVAGFYGGSISLRSNKYTKSNNRHLLKLGLPMVVPKPPPAHDEARLEIKVDLHASVIKK
jgi:hypothetical protein